MGATVGSVQGRGGLGHSGCCQVSLMLGSLGSSAQHISVLWTSREPSPAFGPWQEQARRLTLSEQVCIGTPLTVLHVFAHSALTWMEVGVSSLWPPAHRRGG